MTPVIVNAELQVGGLSAARGKIGHLLPTPWVPQRELLLEGNFVDRSDESRWLLSAAALDRRQFLRGIAATGAFAGAGGLLAACSGASPTTTGSVPTHGT